MKLEKVSINNLKFDEDIISCEQAFQNIKRNKYKICSKSELELWNKCQPGKSFSTVHEKGSFFNSIKCRKDLPSNTLTATPNLFHWSEPRRLSDGECIRLQTFPDDYVCDNPVYICGMSVPPFMMQRVAAQIYEQFFNE